MKKTKLIIFSISIILFIAVIYLIIPDRTHNFDDYSTIVLDANNKILRVFLNDNEQWCFPPNPAIEIPAKLEISILQYEDKYFYKHQGINPVALIRALFLNLKYKRTVSGGSTITMQLTRIADPKSRNILNKINEIVQALKIEVKYSKKQILKMYLDHAPFGRNIVGVQAASWKYFGKEAQNLTWSEAATLAVLPNAPGLISPGRNQQKLVAKRNRLLHKLSDAKIIDKETLSLSLLEPVPNAVHPFPASAPHISQSLKSQKKSQIIKTTIISNIQEQVEQILQQHSSYLQNQGISNACVLIAETETGKIRAYAGSQDYWDFSSNGQVDGVQAPRSTGSILKPFLYALSMDAGIIIPETLMKDIPTYFGSFSPENANKKFDGLVTAKDALIRSLNIPAVRLLNAFGIRDFYHFLNIAGMNTLLREPDDYGLTLIIGGSEATLYDLVLLYRGLGNYGNFTPLKIEKNQKHTGYNPKLISSGACYLTMDILKDLKRPGSEYYWHQYNDRHPLAWKTGTSFGQRDAWAVGVNPQWTIGVWVGNFTGEGNPAIGGAKSAGPILFDIFNSLPKDAHSSWFEIPYRNMKLITICEETGFVAGAECRHQKKIAVPDNMKPLKVCPYCKKIYIDSTEKYCVCSLCWEPGKYSTKNVTVYPPSISQFLRERGQNVSVIPEHNPDCDCNINAHSIQLLYPTNKANLWIPKDIGGKLQKITLKAAHSKKNRLIYWYLDDEYIGDSIGMHTKAVQVNEGKHFLKIIDESGNSEKVTFFVQTGS